MLRSKRQARPATGILASPAGHSTRSADLEQAMIGFALGAGRVQLFRT